MGGGVPTYNGTTSTQCTLRSPCRRRACPAAGGVPGGSWGEQVEDPELVDWIQRTSGGLRVQAGGVQTAAQSAVRFPVPSTVLVEQLRGRWLNGCAIMFELRRF